MVVRILICSDNVLSRQQPRGHFSVMFVAQQRDVFGNVLLNICEAEEVVILIQGKPANDATESTALSYLPLYR